jgi:hypothetical protein
MKINRVLSTAAILLALTSAPLTALQASSMSSMGAQTLKCPACGMPMTKHKTAMMTSALMVHGQKWYCCPMCPVGKKAAEYDKSHPGHIFVAEK